MSDFSSESDMDVDEMDDIFTQAAEQIQRTHATHTPDDLLELYAYYKQATVGRCNTSKPGIFSMQARAKWNAWNDLNDMSTTEAKRRYVEKVQQLDPAWHERTRSGEKQKSVHSWVVHSVLAPPEEIGAKLEHEKTIFDYVKECNLSRLQVILKDEHLQELDEHGLGLIHWATDRNSHDILEFLISSGADVNMPDAEQQTALHYAASCGHVECVRVLLVRNANRYLKDADGQTCIDVAESIEVREILENH